MRTAAALTDHKGSTVCPADQHVSRLEASRCLNAVNALDTENFDQTVDSAPGVHSCCCVGRSSSCAAMASKVKWDEANLEENEAIKAEINPTKIDEPKTPYHRPLSDDGDDLLDGTPAPHACPPPLRHPCPQSDRVAHPQTMYLRLAWRLWTLNQRYAITRKLRSLAHATAATEERLRSSCRTLRLQTTSGDALPRWRRQPGAANRKPRDCKDVFMLVSGLCTHMM